MGMNCAALFAEFTRDSKKERFFSPAFKPKLRPNQPKVGGRGAEAKALSACIGNYFS